METHTHVRARLRTAKSTHATERDTVVDGLIREKIKNTDSWLKDCF